MYTCINLESINQILISQNLEILKDYKYSISIDKQSYIIKKFNKQYEYIKYKLKDIKNKIREQNINIENESDLTFFFVFD